MIVITFDVLYDLGSIEVCITDYSTLVHRFYGVGLLRSALYYFICNFYIFI
jgi:hypothetical protein